jgi:hypothetical protein
MNKLDKFPKIYCASLFESEDRRKNFKNEFLKYNIKNINFLLSERQLENDPSVSGELTFLLNLGTIGAAVSHLKMVKKWYDETNEPYAFFCEDDLSLETVQYWNFNWSDFLIELPENWDCIQLMCIGKNLNPIELRRRYWDDWSVGAYLISRKYAKILIDSFISNQKFLLEYPEKDDWAPLAENLIYYSPRSVIDQNIVYNVYTFPLFVESIEFISTFHGKSLEEKYKDDHLESYIEVLKWWKNIGKDLNLKELLNK